LLTIFVVERVAGRAEIADVAVVAGGAVKVFTKLRARHVHSAAESASRWGLGEGVGRASRAAVAGEWALEREVDELLVAWVRDVEIEWVAAAFRS